MKTVQLHAYVYETDYGGSRDYQIFASDGLSDKYMTLIGPVAVDYIIPDGWSPIPAKLAALDASETQLKAAFQAKLTEIDTARQQLLAITNEVQSVD